MCRFPEAVGGVAEKPETGEEAVDTLAVLIHEHTEWHEGG
jgi:hypothetical protein